MLRAAGTCYTTVTVRLWNFQVQNWRNFGDTRQKYTIWNTLFVYIRAAGRCDVTSPLSSENHQKSTTWHFLHAAFHILLHFSGIRGRRLVRITEHQVLFVAVVLCSFKFFIIHSPKRGDCVYRLSPRDGPRVGNILTSRPWNVLA